MVKQKKYALVNSYFKIARNSYGKLPYDMLEVVKHFIEHNELPFNYHGDNWLYDAFIEKQKRESIYFDQFFTPTQTANRVAELAAMTFGFDEPIVDACCGFGQLGKAMLNNNLKVEAFDLDLDLVEICNLTGLKAVHSDFEEHQTKARFVVSNPPFSKAQQFMEWASNNFKAGVFILPVGFMQKERPKDLVEILKRFSVTHSEKMTESFAHTKIQCEIIVADII